MKQGTQSSPQCPHVPRVQQRICAVERRLLSDFFLPTAVETPSWETDYTTTPSPHHPIGAKGVGESPNVGGVSAFSNAYTDAQCARRSASSSNFQRWTS